MRPEAVHWGLAPVAFSWGRGGQDIPHPLAGPRVLYAWVGTQGPPTELCLNTARIRGLQGSLQRESFTFSLLQPFKLLS